MKESKQRQIFEQWLSEHRALVFKVIRSYAFHRSDREDLFQDICLQIFRSIPNFKGNAMVTTWLYRIALNTAIKWSTKEKKHIDSHDELDHRLSTIEFICDKEDERISWLYGEIQKLNEIDRSLSLLLLEGYSYKEMADIVGISESNIGVKIHRIKKQLIETSKGYEYGN